MSLFVTEFSAKKMTFSNSFLIFLLSFIFSVRFPNAWLYWCLSCAAAYPSYPPVLLIRTLPVLHISTTLLQSNLDSSSSQLNELQRHQTEQIQRQQEQLAQQDHKIQELQVCNTSTNITTTVVTTEENTSIHYKKSI